MGRMIYYVAMSLDGYIADDAGGVEWLEQVPMDGEDIGYEAFYQTLGAVVMGAATYEQILSFGLERYPYPNVESVVMTSRQLPQPEGGQVRFSNEPLAAVVSDLKERHDKDIWLVGGGRLAAAAEDSGLIDLYEVTVIPRLLRAGVSLFAPRAGGSDIRALRLVEHQVLRNGMVRLKYERA